MASSTRPWTPAQRTAIDTRDRTMLLSAAAGSGKTAILTDRVICSLIEGDNPLDLSRILAVTFTRSAAQEMRERIEKALTIAIQNNPESKHLVNQLRLLPAANISTIDSFCISILRRFAPNFGISPSFRVADEQEAKLLRIALMENLIADGYAGKVPHITQEDFTSLISHLCGVKEEKHLGEMLLQLVYRLDTYEHGIDTLFSFADDLKQTETLPLEETMWWKRAKEHLSHMCEHYITLLNEDLALLLKDAFTDDKLYGILENYRDNFVTILETGIYDTSLCTFKSLSCTRGHEKTDLELAAIDHAKGAKGAVESHRAAFTSLGETFWRYMYATLEKAVTTLAHLLTEFQTRYEAECEKRCAYDFSTISRLVHNILIQNGQPSSCALTLRGELDAVYVDEYQDVNSLQHSIFEAISDPTGRFLVGDIKQSIYGFRQADPSIFALLRDTFPTLDLAIQQTTSSHFMSQNFRSDKCVIDFINVVFDFLFGNAGHTIGYCDGDRLDCGKDQSHVVHSPVPVVAFFDSKKGILASEEEMVAFAEKIAEGEHIPPTTEEDLAEAAGDTIHKEAMWVAYQISQLVKEGKRSDGSPIRYSDIAIISRSINKRYKPYASALALYGIPCKKPQDSDFFASPEVLLALALLNTIENPKRDVYLTATLCSPLYRFTADDLVHIRRETPEGLPFFDALRLFCDGHKEFAKGHFFLSQLSSFRDAAESIPVDQLLRRIFEETPLMAISGASTEDGEGKLQLLYNYARTFAGASFSGLYNFIRFVDKQIENGTTFSPHSASQGADAVTLCTIHNSKGLEYPVVFLVECGTSFNLKDTQATILCNKRRGISFKVRDPEGLVRTPHPIHQLLSQDIIRETVEEEMRLLYVALTRAKERLFVTGTVNGSTSFEKLENRVRDVVLSPTPYSILSLHSYMGMIHAALLSCEEKEKWEFILNPEVPTVDGGGEEEVKPLNQEKVRELVSTLEARLSFTYPHGHLVCLPKKLSVSHLKPGILDGTQEETTSYETQSEPPLKEIVSMPQVEEAPDEEIPLDDGPERWFRMPTAYTGAVGAKATDKGIATHMFMQFCDFGNLLKNGVGEETKRLLAKGYLSQQQADIMRPYELELFRKSDLLYTMCGATHIWRELRFNIHLPAHLFTENEDFKVVVQNETVFVQGVIDAVIETPMGELILVDYKTDRLTREERANPALAAAKLRKRHSQQLFYYGEAVKAIFGKTPTRTLIYSLQMGTTFEV